MRQLARLVVISAIAAIAGWLPDARAFGEVLLIEQSTEGNIAVTLSGYRYPCSFGFVGDPEVTIAGARILIVSRTVAMGCPIHDDDKPFHYGQRALLGVLADGAYTVSWTQANNGPEIAVERNFGVKSGQLVLPAPAPIPALPPRSLVLLLLLVGLLGAWHRRFVAPA